MAEKEKARRGKADEIPWWSWLIAGAGLLMVLGSASFLLYRAFAVRPVPPQFSFVTEAVTAGPQGHHVRLRVRNEGGEPVSGLVVEGVLRQGATAVEESAIVLEYVPAGSWRRAALLFARDPRQFDLSIRARGYEQP